MNWMDFFTGCFLMNAMPHYVLGSWGARMLGGFGFGKIPNMLYGLFNLGVSLTLFHLEHGITTILEHNMYLGALFVLLIFILFGHIVRDLFKEKT